MVYIKGCGGKLNPLFGGHPLTGELGVGLPCSIINLSTPRDLGARLLSLIHQKRPECFFHPGQRDVWVLGSNLQGADKLEQHSQTCHAPLPGEISQMRLDGAQGFYKQNSKLPVPPWQQHGSTLGVKVTISNSTVDNVIRVKVSIHL